MQSPSRARILKPLLLLFILIVGVMLPLQVMGGSGLSRSEAAVAGTPTNPGETAVRLEMRGVYAGSGAEISAYHPATRQLFVVTGGPDMEVLDLSDPSAPTLAFTVPIGQGGANSVAIHADTVAVAVANADTQADGFVYFYDPDGALVSSVTAGPLPDMLTFTPDGTKVVVANEGEPNADYSNDPEGSVSVIDLSAGSAAISQADVTTLGFTDFNAGGPRAAELPDDVRIFGPGASVAQDLEPEYVAISADSSTAWVTLQENNAVAVLDLIDNRVTAVAALGFKDFSLDSNQIDPSDRDDGININAWPVRGMYQPDAIAAFEAAGATFLITANEGDARDYDTFSEEFRVGDAEIQLDPTAFSMPVAELELDQNLGRLRVTNQLGDANDDGFFEALYAYGGRSFSIWDGSGSLVFDSGAQIEHLTAALVPELFNANDSSPAGFDSRSDDKGAEPEGVVLGEVNGRLLAFIGLERIGGVLVYDVADPTAPTYLQYLPPQGDDISPEGLTFISAAESPTCYALLAVNYEVSGTTSVFRLGSAECARFMPVITAFD